MKRITRLPGALLVLLVAASAAFGQGPGPLTRAERSDFTETSAHRDVLTFLKRLRRLPAAERLSAETLGLSGEGREIPLVIASAEGADPEKMVRILVNGNIHAGEVEGKEASQTLLREIARGEHADILAKAVLYVVPNFNPDGNDRFSRDNRVSQNGPVGGVGTRANAAGLDLNRDFIKLETPEVKALVAAFNRHDPHYFMDLHTTNGSRHAYHLTYAPSLSTNISDTLDRFIRDVFLFDVRKRMTEGGWRTFDYGNFPFRGGMRSWSTYDHRPRFGTNYYGLRNRFSVVVEAYSYLSFRDRVRVTEAFLRENLRVAARNADTIKGLCAAADDVCRTGRDWNFGWDSAFAEPRENDVLVGRNEEVEIPGRGKRFVASGEVTPERMPVRVAFESRTFVAPPAAWAVRPGYPEVKRSLMAHGLEVRRVSSEAAVEADVFSPTKVRRARRLFQGHHEVSLEGEFRREAVTLPAGTLLVTARQPLARVAAQLLEPRSEDSLFTWNFFDGALEKDGAAFPVLRLLKPFDGASEPMPAGR